MVRQTMKTRYAINGDPINPANVGEHGKIHKIWDQNYGELNREYWEDYYQPNAYDEREHGGSHGFTDISCLTPAKRKRAYEECRYWPMYLNPLAKFSKEDWDNWNLTQDSCLQSQKGKRKADRLPVWVIFAGAPKNHEFLPDPHLTFVTETPWYNMVDGYCDYSMKGIYWVEGFLNGVFDHITKDHWRENRGEWEKQEARDRKFKVSKATQKQWDEADQLEAVKAERDEAKQGNLCLQKEMWVSDGREENFSGEPINEDGKKVGKAYLDISTFDWSPFDFDKDSFDSDSST